MKMHFSPMWHLLTQEGYLAQSSLCTGLTSLRNANLGDKKGLFYSAFFELAIGLERMMKLVIILDHLAKNRCEAPSEKVVRGYGHKLLKLWIAVQNVAQSHSCLALTVLIQDESVVAILKFLDKFADSSGRYANINALSKSPSEVSYDPLAQWGQIANSLFSQHATGKQREEAEKIRVAVDASFGSVAVNLINGLNRESMNAAGLHKQSFMLDVSSQYAVLHLVKLIEGLSVLTETVCDAAVVTERSLKRTDAMIPHMRDFFDFAWSDRSVLRKKRWP